MRNEVFRSLQLKADVPFEDGVPWKQLLRPG